MGMTNKQFQGFIRLALGWLEKALGAHKAFTPVPPAET